jgi:hypothetical protein
VIDFLCEEVQTAFHKLDVDTQLKYKRMAERFLETGEVLMILAVDYWGEDDSQLEITIRIDKKFT